MDFIHREYEESYDHLTVVLSEADKSNPRNYYYAKDERDLLYTGLDPAVFLAFMTEAKFVKRKDGSPKLASFSHMSKYYSAIKWGSTSCGRLLHTKFYADVDSFMVNYKKEFATAKAAGNTEEKEADAICSTLFKLLMTWAVEQGNIFVWCFSLLMWHLMARSINIDCISLHNIKKGVSDSIVFKYDNTKMDQSGEFVQEKNCYSNPLPGSEHLCLFTALGCYLSINSDSLTSTEKLFIKAGSQLRTASANFGRQMSELANKSCNIVKNFVRLTHFSVHGFRKGSGTHASSATTCPPLFTSIAARGEWSMGKVLDVYFQFAASGDHYLGQLLSLKDPNSVDFDTPCPHWKDPSHPAVIQALELTFGAVLLEHSNTSHDPQGVLSLLMASMVHHSSWMLGVMEKYPSHPFHKIPLLSSPQLQDLKLNHITMELNTHVPMVTGMPPHVSQLREIMSVKECCLEIKNTVIELKSEMKEIVHAAIDEKVEADGGINASILDNRLEAFEARIMSRLDQIGPTVLQATANPQVDVQSVDAAIAPVVALDNQFSYKGRSWCLPKDFDFPDDTSRYSGWRMWLDGMVVVSGGRSYKIKPLRKLKDKDFHAVSTRNSFKLKWKPVFNVMEMCPDLDIPAKVDEAFVQSSFRKATEYLKTRVSYVWLKAKDERALAKLSIASWSKKCQRSEIIKCGTDEDKAKLPAATSRNQTDKRKRSFTIYGDARGDGRIRPNKVARRRNALVDTMNAGAAMFENAFANVAPATM
jgi:hypothetical protein